MDGVLRYAQRHKPFMTQSYYPPQSNGKPYNGGVEYMPLFYDIYKRYGAVYWLERPGGSELFPVIASKAIRRGI